MDNSGVAGYSGQWRKAVAYAVRTKSWEGIYKNKNQWFNAALKASFQYVYPSAHKNTPLIRNQRCI